MFVGIFVASEILAVLVAAAKGVSPSLLWLPFLKGSVLRIIEFLFIYSAAAFAMLFTGNTVIAVFGMMVIAGYGPAVTVITEAYIDLGFYTALKTLRIWEISYTTPVGILLYMERGISQGTPWFGAACMTLAGTLAFLVADFWMCTHHKAECGGMALTFPKTEQILKILMVLPGALERRCCWHCGLQHERSKSILLAVCRIHFRSAGARHADGVYLSQGCKTGICT